MAKIRKWDCIELWVWQLLAWGCIAMSAYLLITERNLPPAADPGVWWVHL